MIGRQSSSLPTGIPLLDRWNLGDAPLDSADAAVLVVLRDSDHPRDVLLIERTERPEDPATGQVALPGGHVDPGDRSLRYTALRETQEEVGLTEADFYVPPRFITTQLASVFSLRVAVFATALRPSGTLPQIHSPEEVAAVFWLPREELDSTETVTRETKFGRREVEANVYQGHILWGFTRRVLRMFFWLPVDPR
ncbi:MAG: CoA pyrophosphatase [Thermoplasmata archaeon]